MYYFGNVVGLGKQDIDCWNYIKGFDYVRLCETYINKEEWFNMKGRLPKTPNS